MSVLEYRFGKAVMVVTASLLLTAAMAETTTLAAQGGESQTALSPDSDGGGNAFTLACGADRVLIGVNGGSGQWVDWVQGVCMQVTNDGKWIGSETKTVTSGGTSGTGYSLRCPVNSAVAALSGRAGTWIDKLQVHCRPLGNAGFVTGSLTLAGAVGGSGGTTGFGPNTCDQDKPARSLTGRSGTVVVASTIDRIGLICATPAVFRLSDVTTMAFLTIMPDLSRGTVVMNRAAPADETVSLTSSNPSIASVPSSVTISKGQSSASFTIRPGTMAGCVRFTASEANISRSVPFVVQYPYPTDLAHFDMGSPKRVLLSPGQYKGSVRIDTQHGMVVMMTSNNPSIATVPPSVTIPRDGMGMADYTITAVGRGCAMITATYGPWTIRHYVMVENIPG